jgi:hypothetical protein
MHIAHVHVCVLMHMYTQSLVIACVPARYLLSSLCGDAYIPARVDTLMHVAHPANSTHLLCARVCAFRMYV